MLTMPNIGVGQQGPAFALYNQDDLVIILDRLTSNNDHVVVYFFPQAGAPGCTREAQAFRDLMPEFAARKVKVVGITPSPAAELREFAKANNLNFDVVSDPYRKICEEWGALRGDTVARTTFILNDRGTVTHHFPRVDVFKHAAEVLALFAPPKAAETAQSSAPPPAAQAPAQAAQAQAPAAQAAPAAQPVFTGTQADLIVATARAALQLLLAHQQAGGLVPADVAELAQKASGK